MDFCLSFKNNVKKHLRTMYFNDQRVTYDGIDSSPILQIDVHEHILENLWILSKCN